MSILLFDYVLQSLALVPIRPPTLFIGANLLLIPLAGISRWVLRSILNPLDFLTHLAVHIDGHNLLLIAALVELVVIRNHPKHLS